MKVLFVVAAAALAALAAGGAPAATGAAPGRLAPPPRSEKAGKLDSRLAQVLDAQRDAERGAPTARRLGLDVAGTRVRVVLEARGGIDAARSAAQAAGGEVEATYANLVQALVPPAALEGLSHSPAVAHVRPPHRPLAEAVTGEEVSGSAADAFQNAFWTGAGVKVAIIDLGFAGLADRQAAGDIPAGVTTQDFCGGGFGTATEHGTAVAEIVHEVAPDAQLYLLCINSDVTLGQAEEYAKANGITIVNTSLGILNDSRGDGTGGPGTADAIVADARANGILWIAAAGNEQQRHWSGTFSSGGGDPQWNDWVPGAEANGVIVGGGETACFYLKWDDWPLSSQDFDFYLISSDLSTVVSASESDQTSAPAPPTEQMCYTNPGATAWFYLGIWKYDATTSPRFDMFVSGAVSSPTYHVSTGSVTEPASSPNVMAVGALCWADGSPRDYSSLGPTIDNRVKPDITGLDGVSDGTYGASSGCTGGFQGTSAASPHVAGLAALGKQENPSLTPAELQTWLQARANDIGAPGKDNQFGVGRAFISTFTDTQGWTGLEPEVELLFRKGTTGGCSALDPATGTRLYCPEQTVTRDQMAVFIIRSLGLEPLDPGTPTFADVPSGYWAFGEIERLAEQGITGGCQSVPTVLFCPTDGVRRDQMAAFLVRAKGLSLLEPVTATFADVPTDFWAYGYIERLVEQGITGGCSSNPPNYCPANVVTRRQMAAFLIRTFGGPAPG
ncbi:S8 family serine peptidase [Gaiella sp.]|jgi:subtilisin family serine protease|uniref:S8 family serine peptidase n=1 Tax=Gaiella sp. TaxID=2663207 RepID=UPI002E314DB2|nr:S8 family serine peptidase [Gaiella sp.]HEX5583165.1 S8 family serine peptidase [Gaiella sp.]